MQVSCDTDWEKYILEVENDLLEDDATIMQICFAPKIIKCAHVKEKIRMDVNGKKQTSSSLWAQRKYFNLEATVPHFFLGAQTNIIRSGRKDNELHFASTIAF